MSDVGFRRPGLLVGIMLGVTWVLGAQVSVLELETVEVFPGATGVPLELSVDHQDPITALEIGVRYNALVLRASDVVLTGGVLDGIPLEFAEIRLDDTDGTLAIRWILDSTSPFGLTIPGGADQLLASVLFDVEAGLPPSLEIPVVFSDRVGDPPLSNQVFVAGVAVDTELVDGAVNVTSNNSLIVRNTVASPATSGHPVDVTAANTAALQGFSVALSFEREFVRLTEITVEGTITEIVGAEYVDPIINNNEGFAIVGVLLDILPPFDRQVIPSSGFALTITRLIFDILPEAQAIDSVDLRLVDGLSTPPINNVFVVENQSISPELQSGIIEIVPIPMFLRGDATSNGVVNIEDAVITLRLLAGATGGLACLLAADTNDDEAVNIADSVYSLNYLFLGGPPPPPPFPKPGPDPTPGNPPLPCDT